MLVLVSVDEEDVTMPVLVFISRDEPTGLSIPTEEVIVATEFAAVSVPTNDTVEALSELVRVVDILLLLKDVDSSVDDSIGLLVVTNV